MIHIKKACKFNISHLTRLGTTCIEARKYGHLSNFILQNLHYLMLLCNIEKFATALHHCCLHDFPMKD